MERKIIKTIVDNYSRCYSVYYNRWGQELELYIMTISRLWAFTTAKYKFSLTLTEGKLVVPPANLKFRITIKLQVARARATTYYRDRD